MKNERIEYLLALAWQFHTEVEAPSDDAVRALHHALLHSNQVLLRKLLLSCGVTPKDKP